MTRTGGGDERPVLRVVHGGEPSPEELAALVTALVARAPVDDPTHALGRRAGGWAAPSARLRHPLTPGPGAWVASTRPQR